MQSSQTVTLRQLRDQKYAVVLCYPKYDLQETTMRVQELKKLGIKALEFVGEKTVFNVPVLGKGYVGVVVAAHIGNAKVALKIRRVDADRSEMYHEAEMLQIANKVEVGPRLVGVSENFLVMEFVEGTLLPEWLENVRGRGTRKRVRLVLRDTLEQCRRLDEAGLDHGELSRAPKHIIVDKDNHAYIVDFETASITRRKSNVTSICQYFFIGSQVAKTLQRKLGRIDKEALIAALQDYKKESTAQSFCAILKACRLT